MELIWGIQFDDILLLLKQLGLAVAGAAALWGFVFSVTDQKHSDKKSWIIDDILSMKIFNLFLVGVVLASVSYYFLLPVMHGVAHEGISIPATPEEIIATFPLKNIFYIVLLVLSLFMVILRSKNEERFSYLLTPFYAFMFLMAFFMTSFSAWRGFIDDKQLFHFMHGFHSIFTLGSVVVLDFIFVISSRSELLKQHVYRLFPTISKVIWAGLSLDFLSVFLIADTFQFSEKFLFSQTVIAILIINGVLLSGPIARKMIGSVENLNHKIHSRWRRIGNVSGSLSITSWMMITIVDFFTDLSLSYGQLIIIYITIFIFAFIGHTIFELMEQKRTPLTLSSEEM